MPSQPRHRNAVAFVAVVAAVGVIGCWADEGTPNPSVQAAAPAADHHLHIRSAAGAAITEQISRELGSPGSPSGPSVAADAIVALDSAGIRRGVVLSNAYMFGMPDLEVVDEHVKVRAENDYVAEQVALFPDRLVGACSVNPLTDYALEEVETCGNDPRLSALKLHLANSRVDLHDADDLNRLKAVFESVARLDLPLIVHVRSREEGYGSEDATIFINEVLSLVPNTPVQIAHMAGWGGYDDATDAALGAFAEAFDTGRLNRANYTFDLGAVVFEPAAAGADTALMRTVEAANQRLADRIRQIGLDRVVYATDWPSWPPVADKRSGIERNVRLIREALPLTEEELARVFANRGLMLDR